MLQHWHSALRAFLCLCILSSAHPIVSGETFSSRPSQDSNQFETNAFSARLLFGDISPQAPRLKTTLFTTIGFFLLTDQAEARPVLSLTSHPASDGLTGPWAMGVMVWVALCTTAFLMAQLETGAGTEIAFDPKVQAIFRQLTQAEAGPPQKTRDLCLDALHKLAELRLAGTTFGSVTEKFDYYHAVGNANSMLHKLNPSESEHHLKAVHAYIQAVPDPDEFDSIVPTPQVNFVYFYLVEYYATRGEWAQANQFAEWGLQYLKRLASPQATSAAYFHLIGGNYELLRALQSGDDQHFYRALDRYRAGIALSIKEDKTALEVRIDLNLQLARTLRELGIRYPDQQTENLQQAQLALGKAAAAAYELNLEGKARVVEDLSIEVDGALSTVIDPPALVNADRLSVADLLRSLTTLCKNLSTSSGEDNDKHRLATRILRLVNGREAEIDLALARDPAQRSNFYNRLGLAFYWTDQREHMIDAYERALELQESLPPAERNGTAIASMNLVIGEYYYERRQWARLVETARKGLSVQSSKKGENDIHVQLGLEMQLAEGILRCWSDNHSLELAREAANLLINVQTKIAAIDRAPSRYGPVADCNRINVSIFLSLARLKESLYQGGETRTRTLQRASESLNEAYRLLEQSAATLDDLSLQRTLWTNASLVAAQIALEEDRAEDAWVALSQVSYPEPRDLRHGVQKEYLQAQTLVNLHRPNEAREVLRKIPRRRGRWWRLEGQTYLQLGEPNLAYRSWQKSGDLWQPSQQPLPPWTFMRRAAHHADVLVESGHFEEATTLATTARTRYGSTLEDLPVFLEVFRRWPLAVRLWLLRQMIEDARSFPPVVRARHWKLLIPESISTYQAVSGPWLLRETETQFSAMRRSLESLTQKDLKSLREIKLADAVTAVTEQTAHTTFMRGQWAELFSLMRSFRRRPLGDDGYLIPLKLTAIHGNFLRISEESAELKKHHSSWNLEHHEFMARYEHLHEAMMTYVEAHQRIQAAFPLLLPFTRAVMARASLWPGVTHAQLEGVAQMIDHIRNTWAWAVAGEGENAEETEMEIAQFLLKPLKGNRSKLIAHQRALATDNRPAPHGVMASLFEEFNEQLSNNHLMEARQALSYARYLYKAERSRSRSAVFFRRLLNAHRQLAHLWLDQFPRDPNALPEATAVLHHLVSLFRRTTFTLTAAATVRSTTVLLNRYNSVLIGVLKNKASTQNEVDLLSSELIWSIERILRVLPPPSPDPLRPLAEPYNHEDLEYLVGNAFSLLHHLIEFEQFNLAERALQSVSKLVSTYVRGEDLSIAEQNLGHARKAIEKGKDIDFSTIFVDVEETEEARSDEFASVFSETDDDDVNAQPGMKRDRNGFRQLGIALLAFGWADVSPIHFLALWTIGLAGAWAFYQIGSKGLGSGHRKTVVSA